VKTRRKENIRGLKGSLRF